jgi:dihydrofolate reductase
MGRIIVSEFVTLDGVIQGPGDANEDRENGFEHGGWQLPYFDDQQGKAVDATLAVTGAFLFGRKTYELFAGFWPNQSDDEPFAAALNALPKYVVSTTLRDPLAWSGAEVIGGDVAAEVTRLKTEPGQDIQVIGSSQLVQTLIEHDLVDEYRLMIYPIVLGSGKRLFREARVPSRLRLANSVATPNGVLILTYERAEGAPSKAGADRAEAGAGQRA